MMAGTIPPALRPQTHPFDVLGFLASRAADRREAHPAYDVDTVLRGTRHVTFAQLGGRRVPVRALSALQAARCAEDARDAVRLFGVELGHGLDLDVTNKHALALAVLDPVSFADGRRDTLFTPTQFGELPSSAVDALVAALDRAMQDVYPPFKSTADAQQLADALRDRAGLAHAERSRARHTTAAEYFGVDLAALTEWQLRFHDELTAH